MNPNLILRTVSSPYGDTTLGSVLSHSNLDNNFIGLKGNLIYTATTDNGVLTLAKINGETIDVAISGLNDIYISAMTFDAGTYNLTLDRNDGVSFTEDLSVLAENTYISGMTFNVGNYDLTLDRNDGVSFTKSLSILATDMTITGGTYNINTGVASFTNNSGGTFDVSGFLSGYTDAGISTFTYDNANTFNITDTTGGTFNASFNEVSGLTVNGLLSAITMSGTNVNATTMSASSIYLNGNLVDGSPVYNIFRNTSNSGIVTGTTGAIYRGDAIGVTGNTAYFSTAPTTGATFGTSIGHIGNGTTVTPYMSMFSNTSNGTSGPNNIIGSFSGSSTTQAQLNFSATKDAGYNGFGATSALLFSFRDSYFSPVAKFNIGTDFIDFLSYPTSRVDTGSTSNYLSTDSNGRLVSKPISILSSVVSQGSVTYSIKAVNNSSVNSTAQYAVALGNATLATALNSFAEGFGTTASGNSSHAEGYQSRAGGNYSHAEGYQTFASANWGSHAEGYQTRAMGLYGSHAEGTSTTASGSASHAEGNITTAGGVASHAEGFNTTAIGDYSHTEGVLTIALGNSSHAGGSGSTASGNNSFVHGINSIAGGTDTVVFGDNITGNTDNTVYVPDLVIKKSAAVPTSSADAVGENGSITWDNSYFYWKANGQWLRVSGSTF